MRTKIRVREYLPPSLEIIYLNVEQGFAASYGFDGEAGGGFNENNWDF